MFTVLFPGTVTILIPYWILSTSSPTPASGFRYFGLLPMAMGIGIYFWCAWDFAFAGKGTPAPIDPPKELVARGLYRYVRNPMYVGIVSILIGEALLFPSWSLFQYAIVAFGFYFLFVLVYEEPVLRAKFGESYRQYCSRVPRWLPFKR
jgi:protein-S-isoprenylcysteine O-methyltransferase Ste14